MVILYITKHKYNKNQEEFIVQMKNQMMKKLNKLENNEKIKYN